MESSYTEAVSASLVREFLSRKVMLFQKRIEIIRHGVFSVKQLSKYRLFGYILDFTAAK